MNLHANLPQNVLPAESVSAIFYDALTGLANRSLFNDRLEHGLALAKRHDLKLAVMFLDLDGFKAVNDTHGHEVGDALLQTVADRLRKNTRDDDTVSRIGGDEFLFLVMGVNDTRTVAKLAKEIVDCIQAPAQLSVGSVDTKLSVGIARFPKDGDTADALVKEAGLAMYRAKRDRAEYVFAS
jgi:diguanylate cyclase (GGDEF)-like protein